MTDYDQYFDYLMHRSRLGELYRKYLLYPRLVKRLRGTTLDIGCGIGDMLAFRPNTVGTDINIHTVDYCNAKGLKAHLMQPNVLPFDDDSFESILLDNVLEHVISPEYLLDEVRRVAKPGGGLLVGVPGRLGWHSDVDHKIFYDETDLRNRIELHGFSHEETFYSPLWGAQWLSEKVRQYCVYSLFSKDA